VPSPLSLNAEAGKDNGMALVLQSCCATAKKGAASQHNNHTSRAARKLIRIQCCPLVKQSKQFKQVNQEKPLNLVNPELPVLQKATGAIPIKHYFLSKPTPEGLRPS
jgi:hypothetical protein